MALDEYQRKRNFSKTLEPKGRARSRKGFLFVVQKHQARRLHYDFRLELDGVLKSWAVPKGPCLDPRQKRLAIQVEDHPVEYGDFEGVIPEGEYGSGTVMLWDRGTWTPEGDASEGLEKGSLKFRLQGERLKGRWTLIRLRDRNAAEQKNWLLIKERDAEVRPIDAFDVLDELAVSVKSGRTLDEIASDRDRVWGQEDAAPRESAERSGGSNLAGVPGAKRLGHPKQVKIALATPASEAPAGDRWLHEIKFDGYRMVCHVNRRAVRLISRNGKDWTDRLGPIAEAAKHLNVKSAIVDGEAVVLAPDGTTNFQALQNSLKRGGSKNLKFFAFDLLYLDGYDLRDVRLDERKARLESVLRSSPAMDDRILLSEHIVGDGPHVFGQACKMGLEGIVSKRRDSKYRSGRSQAWLKVKCLDIEEFVVGGYTEPTASRAGFGALLVGYRKPNGQLAYAGRVGTGFTEHTLHDLGDLLRAISAGENPFTDYPTPAKTKGIHWVRPELVVEVEYSNWTDDGMLRHASFRGLRDDWTANEMGTRPKQTRRAARSKRNAAELAVPDLNLTHPDRVLYPEQGITKLGLATYYAQVAGWMLPYVADRPLTLLRAPEGRGKTTFYQRHAPAGLPDAVCQFRAVPNGEEESLMAINDLAGLLSLVQFAVLEIHIWGCRKDRLDRPDLLAFDLDPGDGVSWPTIVDCAINLRDELETVGLRSFVKTTGGKGLHVVIPIARRVGWRDAKSWCTRFAVRFASTRAEITTSPSKQARGGRIYLDYLRNTMGATIVAPYSTRARHGAPVSVPVSWDELRDLTGPQHFNATNVLRRLNSMDRDPWEEFNSTVQAIKKTQA